MSRRHHKKSRNGCKDCKRRHMKCDELRPACSNCLTVGYRCSFQEAPARSTTHTPQPQGVQTLPTPTASLGTPALASPEVIHDVNIEPSKFDVNSEHLEFLHHFCTDLWRELKPDAGTVDTTLIVIRNYAFSNPFLLHELLAFSALHLGIIRPNRKKYYRQYAIGLQSRALALIGATGLNIDPSNCVPVFMFSNILGMYVLAETLAYRDANDATNILDSFTYFLQLHRGVRVITGAAWESLQESELAPILQGAMDANAEATKGTECQKLTQLIESADLSPKAVEAYRGAIQHLQGAFDLDRNAPGTHTNAVFMWPVLITPEFTELLSQRRPEALLILAHYAVVLHSYRHLWIISDGGGTLIETIIKMLGPHWAPWMELPRRVLEEPRQPV